MLDLLLSALSQTEEYQFDLLEGHGIQHAIRTACIAMVLHSYYSSIFELKLSREDLLLTCKACLLHDFSNIKSGYVTTDVNLDRLREYHKTASLSKSIKENDLQEICNIIGLKDAEIEYTHGDYDGRVLLLHDADCLEIIRCTDKFDPRFLIGVKLANQEQLRDLLWFYSKVLSCIVENTQEETGCTPTRYMKKILEDLDRRLLKCNLKSHIILTEI